MNSISLNHSEQPESHLTYKQWNGINQLINNNSIVIKEANKGGAVVMMNKEHYMRMVYSQLHNGVTYKRTNQFCDTKVMTNLTELVKKYHNSLTKKEIDYLTKFNFNTSNFYGLPKILKSDKNAEAVNKQHSECIPVFEPDDLTLQPVAAGPNCPTKRLSTFKDIIIKSFILHLKSYIRDSIDFLQNCSRTAKESTVIYTFDVKSLHKNISHESGLYAVNFWLEKHGASINSRFPKAFILESIKFILKNNNFKFNEEYFNQLVRTTTGTDMAAYMAAYATAAWLHGCMAAYMAAYATLTTKLYAICKAKWGEECGREIEENWARFLYDCEISVDENVVDPKDLLELLSP